MPDEEEQVIDIPDEESSEQKDDKSQSKQSPKRKTPVKNVGLAVPLEELERIKQDNNCDDVTAAIIYHNERKRPSVVEAVKKISKKDRPQRSTSGRSSVPPDVYVPPGTEKVIDAAGEIQADAMISEYENRKRKSELWEEERDRLAEAARQPKEEEFGDDLVKGYVRSAMETDKKIKEKALNDMLGEGKKKDTDEDSMSRKIKDTIESTLKDKMPAKEKTFDDELLGEVKKDLITEVTKKLKGEGMKVTPELVGQIVNGVGSIFDKLEPVFAGYSTKQNILASKEKMLTVAQIHSAMNADNVRTLKDMVYLLKENEAVLKNPVMLKFLENMNNQSSMIMGVIRQEIQEPTQTVQAKKKGQEPVDLEEIDTDVQKKRRKDDDEE